MKIKKKIIMFASLLLTTFIFGQTLEVPSSGDGSENAPYQISTVGNLYWLTQTPSSWDKYFIQTADIDAFTSKNWDGGKGFTPIGSTKDIPFVGKYNGKGYKIKDMLINRPGSANVGVFGYISNGAIIDSLELIRVNVKGKTFVGGLIGVVDGKNAIVKNCYADGKVEGEGTVGGLVGLADNGATVETSYSSTNVVVTAQQGGGLVGAVNTDSSIIKNCFSTNSLKSTTTSVFHSGYGGLVGSNGGIIENCYSTVSVSGSGNYMGGLVGYATNKSIITNCYSIGKINSSAKAKGGLTASKNGAVQNSFWDTETSGLTVSEGGTGKLTAQLVNFNTFTVVGWDFVEETENGLDDFWEGDEDSTINNGYPILTWQIGANGENGDPGDTPLGYTLSVNTNGKGIVILDPEGGTYDPGTKVSVRIIPSEGYAFSHWTMKEYDKAQGEIYDDSILPKEIIMNSNVSMDANFVETLPAFPGAEGGGMYTVGGRGGKVIEVTNLNADGTGSFREACLTEGPRTIVFRVGGTIDLGGKSVVINDDKYSHLTIAGQTAPGGGIQLKNGDVRISVEQVIIRYIRFRAGPVKNENDAITLGSPHKRDRKRYAILDHISAFWGIDETVDLGSYSDNMTIQWSIVAEGLDSSVYSSYESGWSPYYNDGIHKYWNHSRGLMVLSASRNISIHHCIVYNSYKRNPLIQSSDGDLVNNVIVNKEIQVYLQPFIAEVRANFIGNYFRNNSETLRPILAYDYDRGFDGKSSLYCKDNYDARFRPNSTDSETRVVSLFKSSSFDGYIHHRFTPWEFNYTPIKAQPALDAYNTVLQQAGAILPERDSADIRVVNNILSGKAPTKFVNDPSEVGGWPTIANGTPPVDTDHDGMPDEWETKKGLNPSNAEDRNATGLSSEGYTNLEVYLNDIIENAVSVNEPAVNVNSDYKLDNNYPNPFNPSTVISFSIPKAGLTKLVVYNILGEEVSVLANRNMEAGKYSFQFNASNLSSGIYFYRLQSNDYTSVKKMMFIK